MTDRSFTSTPPLEAMLPLVLAVPVALLIVLVKANIALALMLGLGVVAITFMSPLAGLYLLVFSMLLGPEFLVGGMGKGVTLGRGVTLRLDDFILLLVGLAWLARVAVSREKIPFTKTALSRRITFYVVACVFATLLGVMAQRVRPMAGFFFLLKYYEYFFLFFMTVNIVTTQKQVRTLVLCSLITCFLVTLYALIQIPSGERVSAPFEGQEGEPNTLGGYLVFMMAIITGLLITPEAVPRKVPLVGLLVLAGIALQATLSRASFLAAAVVSVIVTLFLSRRSPFALAAILSVLVAAPLWMPKSVSDRVLYTFFQPKEEGQIQVGRLRVDTSTSERLRSWQQSLHFFYRSPLYGMGVTGGPFMDAMYPRVLVETGVLGMTAFMALLWGVFRISLGGYHDTTDPYTRGIILGFLFGFIGLLVHAVGSNTFIIVRIMEPFWLYVALIVKSLMLAHRDSAAKTEPEPLSPLPVLTLGAGGLPLPSVGTGGRRPGRRPLSS